MTDTGQATFHLDEVDAPEDARQSTKVAEILGRYLGDEPHELHPPLASVVDPDAFDTLLTDAPPDSEVRFKYAGHDVAVSASGRVTVSPSDEQANSHRSPDMDSSSLSAVIEIGVDDEIKQGQFSKLEEELGLTPYEREVLEFAIRRFVSKTVDEEEIEMSEELKDATANAIASTLYQEYRQLHS